MCVHVHTYMCMYMCTCICVHVYVSAGPLVGHTAVDSDLQFKYQVSSI